jgi:hypothetical protein
MEGYVYATIEESSKSSHCYQWKLESFESYNLGMGSGQQNGNILRQASFNR